MFMAWRSIGVAASAEVSWFVRRKVLRELIETVLACAAPAKKTQGNVKPAVRECFDMARTPRVRARQHLGGPEAGATGEHSAASAAVSNEASRVDSFRGASGG